MNSEASGIFPERRLWLAVIINLIDDYRAILNRISSLRRGPVNGYYSMQLRQYRREARTHWFAAICDNANIPHSLIAATLDRLDREFRLATIVFTDETTIQFKYDTKEARRERKYLRIS